MVFKRNPEPGSGPASEPDNELVCSKITSFLCLSKYIATNRTFTVAITKKPLNFPEKPGSSKAYDKPMQKFRDKIM